MRVRPPVQYMVPLICRDDLGVNVKLDALEGYLRELCCRCFVLSSNSKLISVWVVSIGIL
jgi:hypothetical protein